MKKSIILVVVLVLLISICLVAFTSCNRAQDYKQRLEKRGYRVYYYDKYSEGISVVLSTVSAAGIDKDKIEWSILAYEATQGEIIVMIAGMKDKKTAQKYYDYLKSHLTEADNIETVDINNKVVLFGSAQGVKDATR